MARKRVFDFDTGPLTLGPESPLLGASKSSKGAARRGAGKLAEQELDMALMMLRAQKQCLFTAGHPQVVGSPKRGLKFGKPSDVDRIGWVHLGGRKPVPTAFDIKSVSEPKLAVPDIRAEQGKLLKRFLAQVSWLLEWSTAGAAFFAVRYQKAATKKEPFPVAWWYTIDVWQWQDALQRGTGVVLSPNLEGIVGPCTADDIIPKTVEEWCEGASRIR